MTIPRAHRALLAALTLVMLGAATAAAVAADPTPEVANILRQTAQVRRLQPLAEVPLEILDRDALRRQASADSPNEDRQRAATISHRFLVLLGLVPPDFDLRTFAVEVVGERAAGFYSRRQKKMYVVSDTGTLSGREKLTVVHEFTHALQDQHFDLGSLLPRNSADSDRSIATTALVEGDATLTMVLWGRELLTPDEKNGLRSAGASDGTARDRAPLILREGLAFPYREGFDFVLQLYQRGGYDAVNQAFREPPRSSEQIIHPEKYLAREAPRPAPIPGLAEGLGSGWRAARIDVMGELDLRILIEQFEDETSDEADSAEGVPGAAQAAAGWGGDSYVVLEHDDGRLAVILNTVWDTEADAAEFYNAFVPTVARRFGPDQTRTLDQPSLIRWSIPSGSIQLLKTGGGVLLIFAPDLETLENVAAQLGS